MINGITGPSNYSLYTPSVGNTPAGNATVGNVPTDNMTGGRGMTADKTAAASECQTCKNRKYQDGSNENVSFKSPTHVSPNAAGSAVRAHEGEHVSNAYTKAAQNNGKVIRASVTLHTAVCPECGRVYVSGGTTNTAIKYGNEDNPYVKNLKAQQEDALKGRYVDAAA